MSEKKGFEIPENWDEELPPKEFYADPVIEIIYEDEYFMAVHKPAGILVHPGSEGVKEKKNLLKLVKWQTDNYLYPIHRLDRPVSGIVIFGKSSKATKKIKEVWDDENFEKCYYLLCRGIIKEAGEFNTPIKNDKGIYQESHTRYWPLKHFSPRFSFCRVQILTGRYHQIRKHFSKYCFNLVGDTIYGKGRINQEFRDRFDLRRTFLHAYKLKFMHPFLKKEVEINCPINSQLQSILDKLDEEYKCQKFL